MISYDPLFELMKKRKISMYKLRKETGLSKRTTYHISLGKPVSLGTLEKICDYLKVPIEKVVEIKFDDADN